MSDGRPLHGYRMLDLSRYLPGPYCSMILADLGMEVLKIEEPQKGDPARSVGPHREKDSVYFLAVNRNKRSMGLNLSTDEGAEIFRQLCKRYDVVLENFSPGTMDRWGLGYDTLSNANPSLIFCSISGFGQTGPKRDNPGHDINYLALMGLLGLMGDEGEPPAMPGILISDLVGGLFASIGILSALVERKMTGKGRYIDISMADGVVSLLCYHISKFGLEKKPFRKGEMEFTGALPCYHLYETSDHRFMTLGAMEPSFWKEFCTLMGHPEMINKQWITGPESQEMISKLREIFKTKTEKEWKEFLKDKKVCCEPVRGIEALFSDLQVRERQMVFEIDHPHEGRLLQAGNPIKLSQMKETYDSPPRLGEHTEEILKSFGYEPIAISLLKEKGVI
jgi:crotonobetainyl-CoA:carnitine CoA-transferase CaiB-like acyl-CoA transferase